MEEIITNNFEETQELGFNLAKKLEGGDIIALYGELGSGKTTFVQGLARGLGIKKRIISPTFIIIRTYKVKTSHFAKASRDKQNLKFFYHTDLYRIENKKDIQGLGLDEILNDQHAIVAIEWAEKIEDLLPKERIDIYFEYLENDKRRIKFLYESANRKCNTNSEKWRNWNFSDRYGVWDWMSD